MKKTVSIKLNKEFRRLYYKGGSFVSDVLVLYTLPNGREGNRLGITVSKKIGKAVRRNSVRRKIRESYRLLEEKLPNGYDLCFVARARAVEADFHKIQSSMVYLLKKSGLLQ